MEMFDKMIRLGGASVLAVTVSGCSGLQIPSFAPQSQAVAPAPVATQVAPAPVPAATAPAPTPVRGNDNPFHRDDDDDDDSGGGGGGGGGNDDNDSGWG